MVASSRMRALGGFVPQPPACPARLFCLFCSHWCSEEDSYLRTGRIPKPSYVSPGLPVMR